MPTAERHYNLGFDHFVLDCLPVLGTVMDHLNPFKTRHSVAETNVIMPPWHLPTYPNFKVGIQRFPTDWLLKVRVKPPSFPWTRKIDFQDAFFSQGHPPFSRLEWFNDSRVHHGWLHKNSGLVLPIKDEDMCNCLDVWVHVTGGLLPSGSFRKCLGSRMKRWKTKWLKIRKKVQSLLMHFEQDGSNHSKTWLLEMLHHSLQAFDIFGALPSNGFLGIEKKPLHPGIWWNLISQSWSITPGFTA